MKDNSGQKIAEKIVNHAVLKNKKVFEIGCGAGRVSSLLCTETNSLTAMDPDENSIATANYPGC